MNAIDFTIALNQFAKIVTEKDGNLKMNFNQRCHITEKKLKDKIDELTSEFDKYGLRGIKKEFLNDVSFLVQKYFEKYEVSHSPNPCCHYVEYIFPLEAEDNVMNVRCKNALYRADIKTVHDLLSMDYYQITHTRCIGESSYNYIKKLFRDYAKKNKLDIDYYISSPFITDMTWDEIKAKLPRGKKSK